MIKDRVTVVKVMRKFIPKRIHQTHTGSWSLVKLQSTVTKTVYYKRGSYIIKRWPDGLDIENSLGGLD